MTSLLTVAQWVAPVATMIAAMMTAANLGARTTGWGFAVFTVGSLCWALVGLSSGQTNLLATNGLLTVVNLVGIWRWLGRQAKYQDGAKAAATESEQTPGPGLTTASGLCGAPVTDCHGTKLGSCVEALIDRRDGQIRYIVVASRNAVGLDEELRGVARASCRFGSDTIQLTIDLETYERVPTFSDRNWPPQV